MDFEGIGEGQVHIEPQSMQKCPKLSLGFSAGEGREKETSDRFRFRPAVEGGL